MASGRRIFGYLDNLRCGCVVVNCSCFYPISILFWITTHWIIGSSVFNFEWDVGYTTSTAEYPWNVPWNMISGPAIFFASLPIQSFIWHWMPCIYIQFPDTYRLWSAEYHSGIVVFGVIQPESWLSIVRPRHVMLIWSSLHSFRFGLSIMRIVKLKFWFSPQDPPWCCLWLRSSFVTWSTKYSPSSRDILACLPLFPFSPSLPCGFIWDPVHVLKDVSIYKVRNPWFRSSPPPLSLMLSLGPDLLCEFSHLGAFFSPYRSTGYCAGGSRVKRSLLIENCPSVTFTLDPLFFYSAFFTLPRFHSMIHSRSRFSLSFWSLSLMRGMESSCDKCYLCRASSSQPRNSNWISLSIRGHSWALG